MKKKKNLKLSLVKETVSKLNQLQSRKIIGGRTEAITACANTWYYSCAVSCEAPDPDQNIE